MPRRSWVVTMLLVPLLAACAAEAPPVRPLYQAGGTEVANDAKTAYASGKRDFASGQFASAASNFRTAVTLSPDDPAALNGLAAAYDRLGRYDLADALYEHSLMVSPDDSNSLNNLGYSLLLRGRKPEALLMLGHAAQLAPKDPVVANNLALAKRSAAPAPAPPAEAAPPPHSHLVRVGSRVYQWVDIRRPRAPAAAPAPASSEEPPLPAAAPRIPVHKEHLTSNQGNSHAS